MIRFVNKLTGTLMLVAPEREEEYRAAGHRLAGPAGRTAGAGKGTARPPAAQAAGAPGEKAAGVPGAAGGPGVAPAPGKRPRKAAGPKEG